MVGRDYASTAPVLQIPLQYWRGTKPVVNFHLGGSSIFRKFNILEIPGEIIELKFIPSESELFQAIPKSVSELFRTNPKNVLYFV